MEFKYCFLFAISPYQQNVIIAVGRSRFFRRMFSARWSISIVVLWKYFSHTRLWCHASFSERRSFLKKNLYSQVFSMFIWLLERDWRSIEHDLTSRLHFRMTLKVCCQRKSPKGRCSFSKIVKVTLAKLQNETRTWIYDVCACERTQHSRLLWETADTGLKSEWAGR